MVWNQIYWSYTDHKKVNIAFRIYHWTICRDLVARSFIKWRRLVEYVFKTIDCQKNFDLLLLTFMSALSSLNYNDVLMCAIASQITSLTIVYSTVYSGADQRKHRSSVSLAICAGNSPVTGEFPAQMASNAENVSIWWRHHGWLQCQVEGYLPARWWSWMES